MSTMIAPPVAPHFVPAEEYLTTMYHPDCDYVDGRVEERNVGEFEHGRMQLSLGMIFGSHEREWSVIVVPECRLQVAKDHFRIPDVMVLRAGTKFSGIVRETPLVCIEVLSPEDTWAEDAGAAERLPGDERGACVVLRPGGPGGSAVYGGRIYFGQGIGVDDCGDGDPSECG